MKKLTWQEDPRKQRYLEWLLTFPREDRIPLTKGALAEDLGVTTRTLRDWDAMEDFRAEHQKRVNERQGSPEKLHQVLEALLVNATSGGQSSVAAARLWMEYSGLLVPGNKKEPNRKPESAKGSVSSLSDEELEALAQRSAEDELAKRRKLSASGA